MDDDDCQIISVKNEFDVSSLPHARCDCIVERFSCEGTSESHKKHCPNCYW